MKKKVNGKATADLETLVHTCRARRSKQQHMRKRMEINDVIECRGVRKREEGGRNAARESKSFCMHLTRRYKLRPDEYMKIKIEKN